MAYEVEQLTSENKVVLDFDNNLSIKDIQCIFNDINYLNITSNKNPLIGTYKNQHIKILIKNISYLGHPHPVYKKRIQIPNTYNAILRERNTILMGIYNYCNTTIFCVFDHSTYMSNALNNSSAHIHTIDLLKANEFGIFHKTDGNNNKLTVFKESKLETVFDHLFCGISDNTNIREIEVFKSFSSSLELNWNGINCYQEMIENHYPNAYQAEWAGWYMEYKFQEFINQKSHFNQICTYHIDKSNDGIDLDLYFPSGEFYGDLKTHSEGTNIMGNNKHAIDTVLCYNKRIWYIVFSHSTEKDKKHNAEVTTYWNEMKNLNKVSRKRHNLRSYLKRMKHSICLKSLTILEINEFNKQYLADFNQGINSDGRPRKPKIMIQKKDIYNDNFAIYREQL